MRPVSPRRQAKSSPARPRPSAWFARWARVVSFYRRPRPLTGVKIMLHIPTRQLRPTASPRRSSFRPILETLEDRCVPANFTVNTLLDTVDANPGDGLAADAGGSTSLRAAIMEANATAGNDTINLPAGTYTLALQGTGENAAATGDLDITDSLTITGADAATTIIEAHRID